MILAFMLISRHGKVRVIRWFHSFAAKDRKQFVKEVRLNFHNGLQIISLIIGRSSKLCNFLEFKDYLLVFKRYHRRVQVIDTLPCILLLLWIKKRMAFQSWKFCINMLKYWTAILEMSVSLISYSILIKHTKYSMKFLQEDMSMSQVKGNMIIAQAKNRR